jgi:hypothetical protein
MSHGGKAHPKDQPNFAVGSAGGAKTPDFPNLIDCQLALTTSTFDGHVSHVFGVSAER